MDGDDGVKTIRGRGRGRGRGGRARGVRGGRGGRGRGKKAISKVVESDEEETVPQAQQPFQQTENVIEEECVDENQPPTKIDLEADILQLEAPTFTTLNRGPPEPMLRLRWDHRVNLVAEKVLNPMIHCCDKCSKPILIYGRMIPCKHVFCLTCAKREDKVCPRCMNKVARVEQTGLGTVFMCTHDGTRYGSTGCRRTYLSQRDLQAHFNHRHISTVPTLGNNGGGDTNQDQQSPVLIISTGGGMGGNRLKPQSTQPSPQHLTSANDPRIPQSIDHHRRTSPPQPPPPQYMQAHRPPHAPHQPAHAPHQPTHAAHQTHPPNMYQPQPNPVAGSMRTNLITVQIQDSTASAMETSPAGPPNYYNQPPPQHPPQYVPQPPYPVPPPQFYQSGPPPAAYPPPPPGPPLPPPRPPPPPHTPHSFQDPPHTHAYTPQHPQWAPQHPTTSNQQFYH